MAGRVKPGYTREFSGIPEKYPERARRYGALSHRHVRQLHQPRCAQVCAPHHRCTRYIERDRVNFVAKFDVDNGAATDLSLESSMYDGSPSAEYESWLLLEPVLAPTEAAALAAAAGGAIVAV